MSRAECPKHMVFGPCGGVRHDGRCEVDSRPCPFVGSPNLDALGDRIRTHPAVRLEVPAIVVDVRAPSGWHGDVPALWRATGRSLAGHGALLGEHVDAPLPSGDAGAADPTDVVATLTRSGAVTIATVTGRDRDLDGARQRMRRLSNAGAAALHCVTGDHPAALGLARPAHFAAEAMTIVGAAAAEGFAATVAESPASLGERSTRLASKQRAGASACILNHSGSVDDLVAFAVRAQRAGVTMPLVAPIPMVGDRQSALALVAFPGLRLPPGLLDDVVHAEHPFDRGLGLVRVNGRRVRTQRAILRRKPFRCGSVPQ